jgi:dienelactone hydrolase
MGAAQLIARSQDVKIAASETARRAALGDAVFHGVDPAAIGLAGHSFGAQTTLAAAGQSFPDFGPKLAVPAFRAFIAFSPSAHDTNDLDGQYRSITAPFLSLTGSQDEIALTPEITPENRTLPFSHMYPGDKYLAWLDTASHMSFGGQPTERVRMPRIAEALGEGSVLPNDVHISKVVRAVTTAFWLAYLEPSTQIGRDARIWLGGSGPRALLAPGDRWRSR